MNLASTFRAITIILTCLSMPVAASQTSLKPLKNWQSVTSNRIRLECSDAKLKGIVERYIRSRFEDGQLITYQDLRDIVAVTYRIGGIKSAQIYETSSGITISIEALQTITDVLIEGNEYLRDKEILKAIDLDQNTYIYMGDLKAYQESLATLYRGVGYSDISSKLTTLDADNGTTTLNIMIKEGRPDVLGGFELIGDLDPLSAEKVRKTLSLNVGEHLDPRRLAKRIAKLKKIYRKEGFLSAAIDTNVVSASKNILNLQVTIKKGPKTIIVFRGKQYFFQDRNAILLKTIDIKDETTLSRGFLEEAKEKLEDFYHRRGYISAKVDVEDSVDDGKKLRTVEFTIKKGVRVKIRSIKITNNRNLSSEKLLSFLSSRFDSGEPYYRRAFRSAVRNLQEQMQEIGFLDAFEATFSEQFSKDKKFVDLLVTVREGARYKFGETFIDVNGGLDAAFFERFIKYKKGKPFLVSKNRSTGRAFQAACENAGYRFCTIDREPTIRDEGPAVDLRYRVETGPQISIGNIFLTGNQRTKDEIILRELLIKTGDTFSPREIERSKRAIQRLGFFSRVRIEEIAHSPKAKQSDLLVTVREKKERNFTTRFGAGSDEGGRVTAIISYLNLLGTGRNLYLTTGVSREFAGDLLEFRAATTYIEPFIFSLPIDGRAQFSFEREEEEFGNIQRARFFVGAEYKKKKWFQSLVKWEIEFRDPFDLQVPQEDLSDFDESRRLFGSIGTITTFDLRNDPLNPTFGYLGRISADYYSKIFLSEEEFYQVFARNTFYLPIYKEVSFVLAVRAGFSATLGSTKASAVDQIPVEKRFRLGGSQTLRGFSRDSVGGLGEDEPASNPPAPGGNSVFNYLAEISLPLFGGFRVVGFTDGGNAFLTNEDFDLTDLRYSAGIGLRYITPVGPLRLDFGFKLDKKTEENLGELHFAVGLF